MHTSSEVKDKGQCLMVVKLEYESVPELNLPTYVVDE